MKACTRTKCFQRRGVESGPAAPPVPLGPARGHMPRLSPFDPPVWKQGFSSVTTGVVLVCPSENIY